MKVCAVSDIHVDINKRRKDSQFSSHLISYISTLNPDVVLLTGDIAGNITDMIDFFENSRELSSTLIFVPGNHDLWVNQDSKSMSWVKYTEVLPKLCEHYGWHYLPRNPLVIDEIGFAGSIGWYDYSLRNSIWDDKISFEHYEAKIDPTYGLSWMDQYYIKLGNYSDSELTDIFIEELKKDVTTILETEKIKSLVIGTHMVPFPEFVNYRGMIKFDFFTAYFGSRKIGNFIKSIHQLTPDKFSLYSIFGQTHIPQGKIIDPNIQAYCVPIGYPREYGKNKNLIAVFKDRIKLINI